MFKTLQLVNYDDNTPGSFDYRNVAAKSELATALVDTATGLPRCARNDIGGQSKGPDNTPESVDLERAGQWIKPTSDYCDITNVQMQVIEGDGDVPTWRKSYFPEPVSYPSSYTAWWNQSEMTYYKYDQAVLSFTTAGPGSTESAKAGWSVIFWPIGNITDGTLNFGDQ